MSKKIIFPLVLLGLSFQATPVLAASDDTLISKVIAEIPTGSELSKPRVIKKVYFTDKSGKRFNATVKFTFRPAGGSTKNLVPTDCYVGVGSDGLTGDILVGYGKDLQATASVFGKYFGMGVKRSCKLIGNGVLYSKLK